MPLMERQIIVARMGRRMHSACEKIRWVPSDQIDLLPPYMEISDAPSSNTEHKRVWDGLMRPQTERIEEAL